MNVTLFFILVLYQMISSIMDIRDIKKYKSIEATEDFRINFYKEAIFYGWIPVVIVALFLIFTPLSLYDIGLRRIAISNSFLLNGITVVLSTVIIISLLYQVILYFMNEKYRKQIAIELSQKAESGNYYDKVMNFVLPRNLKEKRYFFWVSLTAGVCEEIVWRGCMLFLLKNMFPAFHIVIISVIACVLFGIFHCYQGIVGVIKTSVGGGLFVLLYLATDSLIAGMILHFVVDFSSAFLLREEMDSFPAKTL